MKKLNIALLIVLCAISAAVNAQGNIIIDRVLAVVGDNVVLQSEVEAQYQQMLSGDNNGDSLPPNAKCRIFENLLMDKLFVSQAQIDSVVASPDDAAEVLALIETYNLPRSRVQLMPEGTTSAVLRTREAWLAPLCLEHGLGMTDRLHIHLYGDTRGT